MDENVVFKTAAVGGFEKRAVLDYIYQMNEQTELSKQELQNRITELEEELRLAEERVQGANNNLRTAQRDLSTVSSELAEEKRTKLELVLNRERLEKEVQQQKEATKKKELEVDSFINENKDALEQNQSIAAQQKKLDSSFYQMGRIMLDARTDAESIVSSAKEQADGLLSQADLDITEMKTALEQQTTELLTSAHEKAQAEMDLAKEQGERTRKDTETVVENTMRKTKQQSDLAISHVRERAAIILKSSAAAANASTVHLRELRRETLAIRQVITEAFSLLQKKADELDGIIGVAQDTLENEQVALTAKKLTDLPEIDIKEIERQYFEKKAEAPAPKVEPITPIVGVRETEIKVATGEIKEEIKEVIKEEIIEVKRVVIKEPKQQLTINQDVKPEITTTPEKKVAVEHELKAQEPATHEALPLAFNMGADKESSIGSESLLLAKDAFPTISVEVLGSEEPKKVSLKEDVKENLSAAVEEKKELPPFEPLHAWERRAESQPVPPSKDEKTCHDTVKSYPPGLEEPNKEDESNQGTFF